MVGYVDSPSLAGMLTHASRIKKLRNRDADAIRFQRLSAREVSRLVHNGMVFH